MEEPIIEESSEAKQGIIQSMIHEHFYKEGEVNGELKDVVCSCGKGHQIKKDIKIQEGVIQWK